MSYSQGSRHICIIHLRSQYTPFSEIREVNVSSGTSPHKKGLRSSPTIDDFEIFLRCKDYRLRYEKGYTPTRIRWGLPHHSHDYWEKIELPMGRALAASCDCWAATPVWRMQTADSAKDNPGSMRPLGRLDNGEKPSHGGASGRCHAFARRTNYGLGRAGFVGQSFTTITSRSSLRTAGFSAVRSTPRSTSLTNGRHPIRSSSGRCDPVQRVDDQFRNVAVSSGVEATGRCA